MLDDAEEIGSEGPASAADEAAPSGPRRRGTAESGGSEIRRVNIAVNVAVQLLCAVLLFFFINYLSGRHYGRADLSAAGKYSITGDTAAYLERLDSKVALTMTFLSNSKIRDQLKTLLEEYVRLSDGQVSFEEFDPVRDKARAVDLAERYKMQIDQNTVFVDVGGKVKKVTESDMLQENGTVFAGEAAITSAMLAATEGKPKTVYLIAGKGKLREAKRRTALEELTDLSERHFFRLKELTLGNLVRVPADADALLLINPETDFSAGEMALLGDYWETNGSLVLLLNPSTPMPNLYPFLRMRGVWVRGDHRVLFSQVLGIGGAQKVFEVQSKFLGGSPITSGNSGAITVFGGQSMPLGVAADNEMLAAKGIIAKPLLEADEKFWGDINHAEAAPTVGPGDVKPPVYVAASIERGGSDDPNLNIDSSRMVVVGNSTLLDSDHFTRANAEFVMNSINWSLDREERLDIMPSTVVNLRVDLPNAKYRKLFSLVVLFFPGIAFCFAVFVWSARRN